MRMAVRSSYFTAMFKLPVNDKVSPEVAHNPGDLPVVIIKVEDPGGEEIEKLVTMSDPPGYGRLGGGEKEVPQRVSSVILKRVEIVDGSRQRVELHEFVGGGFDEESSYQLNGLVLVEMMTSGHCTYIDHAVYHEVPGTQHVLCEVSVVDQLVDDAGAVLDPQSVQHFLCEVVPQKM